MKLFTFVILAAFCAYTFAEPQQPALASWPATLKGYTGFTPEDCKRVPTLLNAFIALCPAVVINAVNGKKFAPASYSVFMRYAYRMIVKDGWQVRYYYKAYDPTNKVTGKIYIGSFDCFIPTVAGLKTRLDNYAVDASYAWIN